MGVESPPETVFRWLCQLKVAPYSYDWIDNPGRRSLRSLTPKVDRLEPGQEFLVFWLVEFEQNRHKTGVVLPRVERVFGRLAISYVVEPRDTGRCRLVACLSVTAPSSVLESAPHAPRLRRPPHNAQAAEHAEGARRTERKGTEASVNAISSRPAVGYLRALKATGSTARQAGYSARRERTPE